MANKKLKGIKTDVDNFYAYDEASVANGKLTLYSSKVPSIKKEVDLGDTIGYPKVSSTVAGMTDTSAIYVYTGSETGYTAGNWYYYNGSAWTSGGAYNAVVVETDKTLAVADKAADGKATGDAVSDLKSAIGDLDDLETTAKNDLVSAINEAAQSGGNEGLSSEIKAALLDCFANVAWINDDGQDYYDALETALYPPAVLVSISAAYTQSGVVHDTDSLDSLKSDLVVTGHYDDSSTRTITGYTLSGTLTGGTSTITVSYGGFTDTFTVEVTASTTNITLLFDQANTIVTDGVASTNASWYATDYITVPSGYTTLTMTNPLESSFAGRGAFYNSNKEYIRNLNSTTSFVINAGATDDDPVPTNAAYIRLSTNITAMKTGSYEWVVTLS